MPASDGQGEEGAEGALVAGQKGRRWVMVMSSEVPDCSVGLWMVEAAVEGPGRAAASLDSTRGEC